MEDAQRKAVLRLHTIDGHIKGSHQSSREGELQQNVVASAEDKKKRKKYVNAHPLKFD